MEILLGVALLVGTFARVAVVVVFAAALGRLQRNPKKIDAAAVAMVAPANDLAVRVQVQTVVEGHVAS